MKKYLAVAVVVAVLGLLIIPVLIAQVAKMEPRIFQGVELEDVNYREIE